MRFIVDECTGPGVAKWLQKHGHEVFSIYEQARGVEDDEIIEHAYVGNYILITNDKGFGEQIFREEKPHRGVILLRLDDERMNNKIAVIQRLLDRYSNQLENNFIVVSENKVRIVKG
ncbi:MAG: DUF5615 family PIN-like protein [Chloroflexota bacterium]|nr:DUF5615 family PIN-like protein [Chloroflexota bacterium]